MIFDFLKRERDAFELFKEAYRARFPRDAGGHLPRTELNIIAPEPVVEADADAAGACLLFSRLDASLFASVEDERFAEIEWL